VFVPLSLLISLVLWFFWILYLEKLSFKIDGAMKDSYDKQNLKQYIPPNHHYKRFSKEFCTQKIKANKTIKEQAVPNHKRGKDKESERKTLIQLHTIKHLNNKNNYVVIDRNHHIPINTILILNVNRHNSPTKRHLLAN
jgi:hypothetical protein